MKYMCTPKYTEHQKNNRKEPGVQKENYDR